MNWYEDDVRRAEEEKLKIDYEAQMIFYGSSSIRLWETLYEDFAAYKPLNLGFGGSTLEACVYFFDRLMKDQHPQQIVLYAGDNDLGDGKQPKQVFGFFMDLHKLIAKNFPVAETFYISVKPSIARWDIDKKIKNYNQLVQTAISSQLQHWHYIDVYNKMLDDNGKPIAGLYVEDGLHLSKHGYELWNQIIKAEFYSTIEARI